MVTILEIRRGKLGGSFCIDGGWGRVFGGRD